MSFLKRFAEYAVALARALSDESGYHRHLRQNSRAHSPSEWRRYIDERHRRKYQNAKCC